MLFFAHQSYNGSTSKFAIRPFTTKHGLFLDLFQILLTSLPFVVLSFELGCCYSFSLRRGGSYPLFGMYPTSLTVFHVHTDNLLLRVTALLLRVLAPITSCNSPITPPLRPPRLGPAVRSRTTEYPKWSSTIPTPDSIVHNKGMWLLCSNSFPPPSKTNGWVGGRTTETLLD